MMELEHESELQVADQRQLRRRERPVRLAIEPHLARARPIQRAEEMEQRALARAARADDGHELPAGHGQLRARKHLDRIPIAPAEDLASPVASSIAITDPHSCRIASTGVSREADRDG